MKDSVSEEFTELLRDLLSKQLLTGRRTWGEGMKDNKIIFCICKLGGPLCVCSFLVLISLLA